MKGTFLIGQILVRYCEGGGHELRHRDDAGLPADGLEAHTDPEDAAALALNDDAGAYRPLKTAPNLRHGWRLLVPDGEGLRRARELLYPARLGAWRACRAGRLEVTPLRETLGRQTGMYRVTAKISNEQADALVGRFCRSDGGCLRTILWRLDAAGSTPSTRLPAEKFDPGWDQATGGTAGPDSVPLLCQEACNLLVAEARAVVKGEKAAEE